MKVRKKPIVVDAELYRIGLEDGFEYEDRMPSDVDIVNLYKHVDGVALYPFIRTLEGRHWISEGDWIITGVRGERYPIKDSIYQETYELAEGDHAK